jgi:hypothetical protein
MKYTQIPLAQGIPDILSAGLALLISDAPASSPRIYPYPDKPGHGDLPKCKK